MGMYKVENPIFNCPKCVSNKVDLVKVVYTEDDEDLGKMLAEHHYWCGDCGAQFFETFGLLDTAKPE